MYEAFYGLSRKPFQLNPDPQFYFSSKPHRRARSYLVYGVMRGEGFIVITGEVGAGKTTIVRDLLESLDTSGVVAAHLVSTQLGAEDALKMVCGAFGVAVLGRALWQAWQGEPPQAFTMGVVGFLALAAGEIKAGMPLKTLRCGGYTLFTPSTSKAAIVAIEEAFDIQVPFNANDPTGLDLGGNVCSGALCP